MIVALLALRAALPEAAGAPALPTLREVLARDAWRSANALLEAGCHFDPHQGGVVCEEGVTDAVLAKVDAWDATLPPDGALQYLAGLARRYSGDAVGAGDRYRAALALDPTLVEAWYDLGELLLAAGELDEAERAFREVSERERSPRAGWLGPWRLAEVAALRHDARGLEAHLGEALARGFTFRQVAGLPNWQAFYADPALRPTLESLLVVYADDEVRRSLEAP